MPRSTLSIPRAKAVVVNASILKRVLAFMLDLLIINIAVVFPFQGLIAAMIPAESLSATYNYVRGSQVPTLLYVVVFAVTVLAILYFVLLEKGIGQSVGKIFFNLRVLPTSGGTGSWRYVLRSIFLIPAFPFVLLWVVDPVYVFFNEQHQRLTEQLSKTRVVEEVSFRAGW